MVLDLGIIMAKHCYSTAWCLVQINGVRRLRVCPNLFTKFIIAIAIVCLLDYSWRRAAEICPLNFVEAWASFNLVFTLS